jgi:hypothetical protein
VRFDDGIACNRAIDLQHATVDVGGAGIGVDSRKCERASADLGERPASAIGDEAALPGGVGIRNHAGKYGT